MAVMHRTIGNAWCDHLCWLQAFKVHLHTRIRTCSVLVIVCPAPLLARAAQFTVHQLS